MSQASDGTPLGMLSRLSPELRLQIYRTIFLPAIETIDGIDCRPFFGFPQYLILSKAIYEEAKEEYNLHRFTYPDLIDFDVRDFQKDTQLRAEQQDRLTQAMDTAASVSPVVLNTSQTALIIRLCVQGLPKNETDISRFLQEVDRDALRLLTYLMMEYANRLMLSYHGADYSDVEVNPTTADREAFRSERLSNGDHYRYIVLLCEGKQGIHISRISLRLDYLISTTYRPLWNPQCTSTHLSSGLPMACIPLRTAQVIRTTAPEDFLVRHGRCYCCSHIYFFLYELADYLLYSTAYADEMKYLQDRASGLQ